MAFLLGLERELTNKYAGLRTHILVCLGACIFTIISIYGFPTFVDGDNVIVPQATGIRDSGRVAAQIVSGIGFIGAGAVLRNGPMIIGLTTAATLWISAAIGMTCGVGMYDVAILTTLLSVAVLTIIRVFERRFYQLVLSELNALKLPFTVMIATSKVFKNIWHVQLINMEEFSSKRLIENPEKSKVSSRFELNQKKLMNDIYNKLTELCAPDSVTMRGTE